MIGPLLLSMRASNLRWPQESRRLVASDPAAAYCVGFSERRQKSSADGLFGSDQALAADYGGDRTLTYSTQATTILTPTAIGASVRAAEAASGPKQPSARAPT